jgi:hypothetical protein
VKDPCNLEDVLPNYKDLFCSKSFSKPERALKNDFESDVLRIEAKTQCCHDSWNSFDSK